MNSSNKVHVPLCFGYLVPSSGKAVTLIYRESSLLFESYMICMKVGWYSFLEHFKG